MFQKFLIIKHWNIYYRPVHHDALQECRFIYLVVLEQRKKGWCSFMSGSEGLFHVIIWSKKTIVVCTQLDESTLIVMTSLMPEKLQGTNYIAQRSENNS